MGVHLTYFSFDEKRENPTKGLLLFFKGAFTWCRFRHLQAPVVQGIYSKSIKHVLNERVRECSLENLDRENNTYFQYESYFILDYSYHTPIMLESECETMGHRINHSRVRFKFFKEKTGISWYFF